MIWGGATNTKLGHDSEVATVRLARVFLTAFVVVQLTQVGLQKRDVVSAFPVLQLSAETR